MGTEINPQLLKGISIIRGEFGECNRGGVNHQCCMGHSNAGKMDDHKVITGFWYSQSKGEHWQMNKSEIPLKSDIAGG